jgi:DNA-binding LytR/AlgR family response regulator
MIKVLIIEDNLVYAKNILNNILNEIDEINVKYITTTVKESIDIIYSSNIDLIFLDLKLLDGNGIDIIEKIESLNHIKRPSIIVISGDIFLSNQIKKRFNTCTILNKMETQEYIRNAIVQYIHKIKYNNEKENIREKIISELNDIGYNFKYIGTVYLLEAIIYIYKSNNLDLLDNLERNVYKYISFKYNKSVNNIKTNIIKATIKISKSKDIDYTPKFVISNIVIKMLKSI